LKIGLPQDITNRGEEEKKEFIKMMDEQDQLPQKYEATVQ
jgi:hypothetical protein